jgi:hypothetical protein
LSIFLLPARPWTSKDTNKNEQQKYENEWITWLRWKVDSFIMRCLPQVWILHWVRCLFSYFSSVVYARMWRGVPLALH